MKSLLTYIFTGWCLLTATSTLATAEIKPLTTLGFGLTSCPKIEAMSKDRKGFWIAKGGWKSDSVSFSDQLDHFLGAQWQGINFGEIICIYSPAGKPTFPVAMLFSGTVPEPKGYRWGPNNKGVKDCHSKNPAECPFLVEKEQNENIEDIYQALDSFKNQPTSSKDKP